MCSKLISFLKKWKIVDTSKYHIIPKTSKFFMLSDWQKDKIDKLKYIKSYTFGVTSIGYTLHVKDSEGNIIDITDYNTW